MTSNPCKELLTKYHGCLGNLSDNSSYCGGIKRVYRVCELLCSNPILPSKHCNRYLETVVKRKIPPNQILSSTEKIS